MADAEIQILITAIDEISGTLKKIEGQLETSNKNIQTQTTKTTEVFGQQITTLLALGNVAQKLDHIWTAYQNMQIRLENASTRLTNAQERLEDAQTKLNRMVRDGVDDMDKLQDAQKEVERASRNLIISKNNLARVNNAVIGTYIMMGTQLVSAVYDFYKLYKAIRDTAIATTILKGITSPAGLAIGLLAAGAGVAAVSLMMQKNSVEESIPVIQNYNSVISTTTSNLNENNIQLKENNQLRDEAEAHQSRLPLTNKAQQEYNDLLETTGTNLQEINQNMENFIKNTNKYQTTLKILRMEFYGASVASEAFRIKTYQETEAIKESTQSIQDKIEAMQRLNWEMGLREGPFGIVMSEEQMRAKPGVYKEEQIAIAKARQAEYGLTPGQKVPVQITKPFGDFISRPGRTPISFSPQDTIIGAKDISRFGGLNITITGNIYGTNPDEIAEAIADRLRRKITV